MSQHALRTRSRQAGAGLDPTGLVGRQNFGAIIIVNSCSTTAQVAPDEHVQVDVEIENVGDDTGGFSLEVSADGQVVAVDEITDPTHAAALQPGESAFRTPGFVPEDEGLGPGSYTIEVNGRQCGTLTVLEEGEDAPEEGDLVIQTCDIGAGPHPADEAVSVSWELVNHMDETSHFAFPIEADGTTVVEVDSSTSILNPIGAGEAQAGATTFVPEQEGLAPGTYTLAISGLECGEFEVGAGDGGPGNGGGGNGDQNGGQNGDQDDGLDEGTQSGLLFGLALLGGYGLVRLTSRGNRQTGRDMS